MDDIEMQQTLDIRDFEIERRLDAFARARLSPDPAAVARTRARVMREARLQFEAARIAAHVVPAVTLATHRSPIRRFATPILAASMWVGIAVGSVAAAQAGGPLYPTRIWIENATLPAGGADRTRAELSRMDARLGDAMSAAARGDAGAVAAALDAYRQIADETVAGSTGDDALEAAVGAALDRHVAVLSAVADSLDGKGNTTAAAAVETAITRAIEHNTAVVANLATNGGGKPASGNGSSGGRTSGGSGATGGGSGSGSGSDGAANGGGSGGGGNGNATGANSGGTGGNGQNGDPKPTKEPKPTPQPQPQPQTKPSALPTETPDHTPHHPSE